MKIGFDSIPWAQVATVITLTALIGLLELYSDMTRPALSISREMFTKGEYWRALTANLVHMGPEHTRMNILGIILVACVFAAVMTASHFLWACFVSGLAVGMGWVILMPATQDYVGFSGILHGLFAYGAFLLLRSGLTWFGAIVMGGLAVKLAIEVFYGAVPGSETAVAGAISLLSHALGAFGGIVAASGFPALSVVE